MCKFLISAVLATAAMSAPAAAQYWERDRYEDRYYDHRTDERIERQLQQLFDRIDRAYDRRLISNREAQRLNNQVRNVGRMYRDFRRGGISPREHQILQRRIHELRQRIQWELREGREERRWDRRW